MSRPPKRSEPFHLGSKFFDVPDFDWSELATRCLREARRVAGPDDAGDIAQEAMIRVWRSLRNGAVPDQPGAWLRTIVRHEAFRHRNKSATTASLDDHFDLSDRIAANRLDLLPLQVDVRRAVRSLTPQDRKLLALRYVDDLTQPAVASALGIPEGTAKVRLHRARGRLQQVLAEHEGGEHR
ncbi:RNA polymerase sigma factor [Baekduia sp.]|uniref:RNA polymerase sigma factor n=1 Tax=Baekduia sp. TaxID=2600305 RepID=UPI0039C873D5